MITQDLARELIPFVNSEEYPVVQRYINSRLSYLKEAAMTASNMDEVLRFQGAYAELKQMLSLREIVNTDKGK